MGLAFALPLAALLAFLCKVLYSSLSNRNGMRKNGCSAPPKLPQKDPVLGLDEFVKWARAMGDGSIIRMFRQRHEKLGKTFQGVMLGTNQIYTMDSKNIQTVLALDFDSYGLEPLRGGVGEYLVGKGIQTSDGPFHKYSRSLVRPTFARNNFANFASLQRHVDEFMGHIPRDSSTFDIQPLLQRLFLDEGTEFLFGESAKSLSPESPQEMNEFLNAHEYAMRGLSIRLQLGKTLQVLHQDKKWFECCRVIHRFLDRHVYRALELQEMRDKSVLLHEMARVTRDPLDLRNQIFHIFFDVKKNISTIVSNVFFNLSRHPKAWQKLRAEVLEIGDDELTVDVLKSKIYLRWVVNETFRIMPLAWATARLSLRDTLLPHGGGPKGTEPIFVPKGTRILVNWAALHMDRDYWGDDVEEWRPERWQDKKPTWEFLPFSGGPRICVAQQLALSQAYYVIVRLMREFKNIESRDSRPFDTTTRLGVSNKNGVKIVLTPA
ncbi:cytochrome P450 alkane hydroxylase-like protein [Lineolata rhizophorae]|uniref:Cytochrome P450 alkane hydroxylase-like protein n=1 Tax=Lineolata rhizophorae TaxID=578093 RepID=A0A6A6NRP2_9PEZI|nr:cytochrome P450 alkane hydroxylase-like protein [Lineolata rhizophorae]